MVFKKPRNSRDDKSGRSSNKTTHADDKSKKSSTPRGKSSMGSDKTNNTKGPKKFGSEKTGERKSFSSSGKSFQSRPYGDKAPSSFNVASGPSSLRSRPYTGRPADNNERPHRSFGGELSGGKKSFTTRSKPYTGRVSDNDETPKRNHGNEPPGEKRSFSPRENPYSGRSNTNHEQPKRSFGGETSRSKKSYIPKDKPSDSSFNTGDRPKKNYIGEKTGERKFTGRPSTGKVFKKLGSDKPYDTERAQRARPSYDKITPDRDALVKTLRGRKKTAESKDNGLIRLNRYISNAGICSRRKADELIAAGVVSVNGIVVSELGHKVDAQRDEIRYNGELLKREKMVYVLLNKPKDYITTTDDPQERRTVMHLVEKASKERIYPIGRLDRNTTGLLLMTNDGDLADKLSHPRNSIVKLYQVELNKNLTQGDLNKIEFGLELEDGLIKPDSISYVTGGTKREIGIQIHSGKNRIVRRIFENLGYEVVKLDRSVYANLTKKDLPRGRWRFLDEKEIIQLKHLIQTEKKY